VPSALTATTVTHGTPEHCLLGCMSTVVVAVKVGPAAKGFGAASGKGAAEHEDARVGCRLDSADVGGGLCGLEGEGLRKGWEEGSRGRIEGWL
jgi:hypothetical protein